MSNSTPKENPLDTQDNQDADDDDDDSEEEDSTLDNRGGFGGN